MGSGCFTILNRLTVASIAPSPLLAPTSGPPSSKLVDSFPRSQILSSTERPATFGGARALDEHWPDRRFRRRRNLTGDYEDDLDAEDPWFLEEDVSNIYGEESASFRASEVDWWVRKPPKKRRPGDLERLVHAI